MALGLLDFFVPQYSVEHRAIDMTPSSTGGVVQLSSDCGNGFTVLTGDESTDPACRDHQSIVLVRAGVAAALVIGLWSWGEHDDEPTAGVTA